MALNMVKQKTLRVIAYIGALLAVFSQLLLTAHAQVDSRPIYERISTPNSADLLVPSFATSNPTIAAFVNFLFDLFVRRMLPWLAAVMVLLIIWAGYIYIMANGDSAKIKQAKDMILYSIIAMVLAIAALSIITILNNVITAAR